jgi:hypothetical protein
MVEVIEKTLENELLRLLKIENIQDRSLAIDMVIDALAVISNAAKINDLNEVIKKVVPSTFKVIEQLPEAHLNFLNNIVSKRREEIREEDIYEHQIRVQKLIDPFLRKKLAAYFTKPVGLQLMSVVTSEYIRSHDSPITLCDPFLGSGLTLTSALKKLEPAQVYYVWGIEPHPLSALIAYAAILSALKGAFHKIEVHVGDAFEIVYKNACKKLYYYFGYDQRKNGTLKTDVILTNPPFTRWELLSKEYRTFLQRLIKILGYDRYINRVQLNLQLISLFLMDYVLNDGGLLVSVLPASTFYTIYGEAAKRLLKEKYHINAIVECCVEPSFSIDSGFKELILIAEKGLSGLETAFVSLRENYENQLISFPYIFNGVKLTESVNWVNLNELSKLWEANWLVLFGHNELREILNKVLTKAASKGTIDTWINCLGRESIVRGIEMYGPDFFFVPNKYWRIINKSVEKLTLKSVDGEQLEIPNEFFVPALRKPELYKDTLEPCIDHFFVAIPPRPLSDFPADLIKYIRWGEKSQTAKPAMKVFGEMWYSHVYKQLRTKRPLGRIFLPDKIDPTFKERGIFASFSEDLVTASKNFYVVTLNQKAKDKVLAAWFNSTVFIAYFVVASRQISKNWTRFLENDYLIMPVINVNLLDTDDLTKIEKNIEPFKNIKLPPLRYQLEYDFRRSLDLAMLEALEVYDGENVISELYAALKDYWKI